MECGEKAQSRAMFCTQVSGARGCWEEHELCFDSLGQSPAWLDVFEPAIANNEETCTYLPRLLSIQPNYINNIFVLLSLSSTQCSLVCCFSLTWGLCRAPEYHLHTLGLDFP